MMLNKRSIVAWMMALLVAFLASCGSPAPPPTYSDAELQQIEQYTTKIVAVRDRMDELNTLIQKGDWVNVDTFIHGPLGDLRSKTNYLTQSLLLPKDKAPVSDAAKEVFQDLEEIDVAAAAGDKLQAAAEYKKAVADFDTFLGVIPKSN